MEGSRFCQSATNAIPIVSNQSHMSDNVDKSSHDKKNKNIKMQVIDALIQALAERGVRKVYGVPGDYVLTVFDRFEKSPIEMICTAGEEGAGFAADAHARLHGLGVAVVTYGVGALKLLNPVAGAFVERSPLLVISGSPGVRESDEHALLHHQIRASDTQQRFFNEICAETACLNSVRTAGGEMIKVLEAMARESRPGYIELPRDCLTRDLHWPLNTKPEDKPVHVIPESLNSYAYKLLEWLRKRKNPLVIAGVEIARFGLGSILLQILEREGWPVVTSLSGKSILPEFHPQHLGVYEGAMSNNEICERVRNSDGLLIIGMPFGDLDTGIFTMTFNEDQCINVDIDHGVRWKGEQEEALDPLLLLRIWEGESQNKKIDMTIHSNEFQVKKNQLCFTPFKDKGITTIRLIEAIDSILKKDDVVLVDPGDSLFASATLKLPESTDFLTSGYWASLGFALPGSVGAWGARPDHQPVVMLGDGSFLMSAIELATIARYHIPALIMILDNEGYGTERPMMDGPFNDVQPVNHVGFAHSIGVKDAVRVITEEQLWDALKTFAPNRKGPVLISVKLPNDDCSDALSRLTEALGKRVKS